jgi:uncharacterized protein YecE (DUF72 family)
VPPEVLETARDLPAELRLGTSSWSFPGWEGLVYDRPARQDQLAKEGLAAYAEHPLLRTVGIDRTYYAPIDAATYARYAASVPADFRFLAKAGQAVVNPLTKTGDNPTFLDAAYALEQVVAPFVEGLGEKAGPLLFQFPPLDLGLLGGAEAFVERLHRFLQALPRGPHYAVELRTKAALRPSYREALRDVGASHCLNEHPSMPGVEEQARQAYDALGPALVVRWMLARGHHYQSAREAFAPFDRVVLEDSAARAGIAEAVVGALRSTRPAYVVVNNKAEGCSPLSVSALAKRIAAALS